MAALFVEKKQRLTQTAAILKKPLASRGRRCYNNKALGGVAHLGERLNGIQEVVGSIPIISTKRKKGTVRCLFLLSGRRRAHPSLSAKPQPKQGRQERLPGKFLKYPLANRKKRWYNRKALGGVAHLGERLNGIQEVVGSIPIVSTKEKGIRYGCLFCFVCKPRP